MSDIIALKEKAFLNFAIIPELNKLGYSRNSIAELTGFTPGTVQSEIRKSKSPCKCYQHLQGHISGKRL